METMKNNKERAGHLGSARSAGSLYIRPAGYVTAWRGNVPVWAPYPCGTCGSTDEHHDRGACATGAVYR